MYHLRITRELEAAVVRAEGDLDAYAAPDLTAVLAKLLDEPRVVFDLTAVAFMDSTALGLVARGVRELRERGRRVHVVLPETAARRIFEITTLDRALPVAGSVAEALSAGEPEPRG